MPSKTMFGASDRNPGNADPHSYDRMTLKPMTPTTIVIAVEFLRSEAADTA